MNRLTLLLLLLGAAGLALWAGQRPLATSFLIAIGLGAKVLQRRDILPVEAVPVWSEVEVCADPIPYSVLVLSALGWAASGKTAYVPPGEDADHPSRVYIGYDVPSGLGEGQTFLPEIEVTECAIRAVQTLGAGAGRAA